MPQTMSKAKRRKLNEAKREARMATVPVAAYRNVSWATDPSGSDPGYRTVSRENCHIKHWFAGHRGS